MISSQHTPNHRSAFTLIELLTVIAIVGILTAILIPTVGRVQETARRTVDQSNIRQIGQAALIYSNDYDGRLPGTSRTPIGTNGEVDLEGAEAEAVGVKVFAAALARSGGMNEAALWVSRSDQAAQQNPPLSAVLDSPSAAAPQRTINTEFADAGTIVSYMAVSGLDMSLPASTPVVFTRGLGTDGTWALGTTPPGLGNGVYSTDGGYITFLGGNVAFFTNVAANPLSATDGTQTVNILETIPISAGITTYAGAPLSAESGVAPGGGE